MSDAVVVVGPKAVIGPGAVDPEMAAVALDCIDDELALLEERVLPVGDLWRDVLGAAANGPCATLVLVHPSWWTTSRVDRVVAAARGWAANVDPRRRSDLAPTASTVVEVSPELVVVHADGQPQAIPRVGGRADIVDAVVARLAGLPAVIVAVPSGAATLGAELARALRRRGTEVTMRDDRALVDALRRSDVPAPRRRLSPRAAAVAVAILSASALTATAAGLDGTQRSADATWLVEGRVAVEIPARWVVERITAGPGSARVQVVSPEVRSDAIHVTQSRVPAEQTMAEAADSLRGALGAEPDGVFVDFTWPGERASRPAITYREIRPDRLVEWAVLVEDGVRIAIGCQGAVGRAGPKEVCARAVGSARGGAR